MGGIGMRVTDEAGSWFQGKVKRISRRDLLFSPLGKLIDWAIHFACINFFLGDKLSQDPLD